MLSEACFSEIENVGVVEISLWFFLFVETVDNFLRMSFWRVSSRLAGTYTCPVPRATNLPKYGILVDGRDADYVARAPGNPRAAEWTDLEDFGAPATALPRITCNCGRPRAWAGGSGPLVSLAN
jgi:hypothetical protein